jgi:hypothetical protein
VTGPAVLDATGAAVVTSPIATYTGNGAPAVPAWSDQDAENAAMVMRRLQQTQVQVRNSLHVRELKSLYGNACMFCGKQTVIGVEPSKYYSEAAHIKPVGQPHNGPDQKDNMLLLCPEHHLQFDYGILRITRRLLGSWVISSKIPNDPLNGVQVRLKAPHKLDVEYWPAPGSADTELGVLMEPEVGHGETEVYTRVQA